MSTNIKCHRKILEVLKILSMKICILLYRILRTSHSPPLFALSRCSVWDSWALWPLSTARSTLRRQQSSTLIFKWSLLTTAAQAKLPHKGPAQQYWFLWEANDIGIQWYTRYPFRIPLKWLDGKSCFFEQNQLAILTFCSFTQNLKFVSSDCH